jgi:rare lipoprotein A
MNARAPLALVVACAMGVLTGGCYVTRPESPTARTPPVMPDPTISHGSGPRAHQPEAVQIAPPQRPRGPGNPPFYDVMGERYFVLPESDGYLEEGVASWYGREFHGRRTSNGERYDMYAISAAHKTLPLPTTARVTNLQNGKSIVVRINDRGPFKKGRIIDLSYGAARELGFVTAGTALVEVEALPEEPGSAGQFASAPPPAPGAMFVQVGAFGERANAEELKRQLARRGLNNVVIRYDARGPSGLHRVRIGPVADAAGYDAVVRQLEGLGLGPPQLVVERGQAGAGATADAAAAAGG